MSPKKWSKNTFGWARAEVLGALVNAVFLVALCFSITVEACKRFIEVEEIHKPRLLVVVGVLGLLINLVGLCLFHGKPFEAFIDYSHFHRVWNLLFFSSLCVVTSLAFEVARPMIACHIRLIVYILCMMYVGSGSKNAQESREKNYAENKSPHDLSHETPIPSTSLVGQITHYSTSHFYPLITALAQSLNN